MLDKYMSDNEFADKWRNYYIYFSEDKLIGIALDRNDLNIPQQLYGGYVNKYLITDNPEKSVCKLL